MDIEIKHYEKVNYTPAIEILSRANVDMMANGQADSVLVTTWDNLAFVAFLDGKAIAVLSYSKAEWANSYLVNTGWVSPEHRRSGIYSQLWDALVKKCQEDKILRIAGATAMHNAPMRALAAKQGRIETSVNLEFIVPAADA